MQIIQIQHTSNDCRHVWSPRKRTTNGPRRCPKCNARLNTNNAKVDVLPVKINGMHTKKEVKTPSETYTAPRSNKFIYSFMGIGAIYFFIQIVRSDFTWEFISKLF